MFRQSYVEALSAKLHESDSIHAAPALEHLDAIVHFDKASLRGVRKEIGAREYGEHAEKLRQALFGISVESMTRDLSSPVPVGADDTNVVSFLKRIEAHQKAGSLSTIISQQTQGWDSLMKGLAAEMTQIHQAYGLAGADARFRG